MGSNLVFQICVLFVFSFSLLCIKEASAQRNTHNVVKYGAINGGKTDISEAILKAWKNACNSKGRNVVLIPRGIFMSRAVELEGPCNGPVRFAIKGVLQAPTDPSSHQLNHWIALRYIDSIRIDGGGILDGQGASAWPFNNCNKNKNCKLPPPSLRLDFVNNSFLGNIVSVNSKYAHINLFGCNNIRINNIKLSAPEESPNTDGIHISKSSNIKVLNSQIGTGDDCISLSPGSKDITISNVQCGPGHGISIGSLGKFPDEEDVTGVTVRNCLFNGTDNGVRIKTWASPHSSIVSDIIFEAIQVINVRNPIIIDQNYCPTGGCGSQGSSNVKISNVKFNRVWGTSSTEIAVDLQCSKTIPCRDIELHDINIVYHGSDGDVKSSCSNVIGSAHGRQIPKSCLPNRAG